MEKAGKIILAGSFYKFLSSFIIVLLGIITSVVINRYYGMEQYGLLVMVFTVTGFLSGFTNLGSKATINRWIPKMVSNGERGENISFIIFTGSILLGLGVVIFACIMYLTRAVIVDYYKRDELMPLLVIGTFYLIGFSLVDFLFSIYQSFQDWLKEGILSIIYPFMYLAFIFIAIYFFNAGIIAVLFSNILAALLTSFLGIFLLREKIKLKYISKYDFNSFKDNCNKFITFGFPLLLTQLIVMILAWADKFILGMYSGATVLSIYYIANSFINGLMIFIKVIFMVIMPYAAGLSNHVEIENKYNILFKINIYFSMGISLIMFLLIDWIVKILYGNEYESVAIAFKLLLPLILIKTVLLIPSIFLQNVFEMVKTLNTGGMILAVIDIIMCIILIPYYSFIGAIIASITAHFVYMCWILWFVPKIKEIMVFSTIYRSVFFIIILTFTYFFMNFLGWNQVILTLPLLLGIYITMLVITKEFVFIFKNIKKLLPLRI